MLFPPFQEGGIIGEWDILIRAYGIFSALDSFEKRCQVLGPERSEEFSYLWNAKNQQD